MDSNAQTRIAVSQAQNKKSDRSVVSFLVPEALSVYCTIDSTKQMTEKQPSSTVSSVIDSKNVNKLDISPATLEALKTLSSISASEGVEKLSSCDKLTASLEQIRANRSINLFEKLDKIRQDFSGLNNKLAQMEESILDLKEVTSNLVRSLPSSKEEG